MKRFAVLVLVVVWATADAEVYKRVGPDGAVSFSDRPGPDAEQIDVPPAQTVSPPPASERPAVSGEPRGEGTDSRGAGAVVYTRFDVVSPVDGEAVRANDGNVTEKYQLSIPGSEPNGTWSSVTAGAPGAEEYRISGIFKNAQPVAGNFLASDSFSVSTARVATATDLALDADGAGEKGYNVATSAERKLWFKFEAPSSTVITTQQTITVRITAQTN